MDVECQQNLDILWLVPCLTAPQSFQYYLHIPRKYVFWAILAQFFLPYQEITFSLWLVTQTLRNKTLIITSFVLCAWAEKSIKKIKEVRRTRTKNFRTSKPGSQEPSFFQGTQITGLKNCKTVTARFSERSDFGVTNHSDNGSKNVFISIGLKFENATAQFNPVFKHLKFDASRLCFYRMR